MKLHLGCFDQPVQGWYNTDITPHIWVSRIPGAAKVLYHLGKMDDNRLRQHSQGVFKQVHFLDVAKPFTFATGSIEAIFSSHIIEHLSPGVAEHMLSESLRVLRPGGVCRVVAPSLKLAISHYSEDDPTQFLREVFEHDHLNPKNRHQWMYNEASLSALMKKVGFTGVSAESYRTGRLPVLESIDNRPKNSIYVEGCKGEV